MQNDNYDKSKLVMLPCVVFIFVVIFSSTTMVATAITAQNNTNNATLDKAFSWTTMVLTAITAQNNTNNAIETKTLEDKGTGLLGSGKYNESIAYYDKALAIEPKDLGALTSKGLALSGLGKYNESIAYYDKALAIDPKYVIAIKEKEVVVAAAAHNANSTTTKKP